MRLLRAFISLLLWAILVGGMTWVLGFLKTKPPW